MSHFSMKFTPAELASIHNVFWFKSSSTFWAKQVTFRARQMAIPWFWRLDCGSSDAVVPSNCVVTTGRPLCSAAQVLVATPAVSSAGLIATVVRVKSRSNAGRDIAPSQMMFLFRPWPWWDTEHAAARTKPATWSRTSVSRKRSYCSVYKNFSVDYPCNF